MTNGAFPLQQDSLEQGLIASALGNNANWLELKAAVAGEDFTGTQHSVFRFVEEYQTTYGNLPTKEVIAARFDWHPPLGDFQYWLTEMKRYILAKKLLQALQEAYNGVKEPESAINRLIETLSITRAQMDTHIQAYDASAKERLEKFKLRTEYLFNRNQILGLKTGLKIIDDTRIGWTPGNLVGVYARPSVGKTWWLLWQGAITWLSGRTVLLCSGEMPANQLSLRIDALLCDLSNIPIDYNKLLRGDPAIENNYTSLISQISTERRWWTYDSANGSAMSLGDISTWIRQHKPDIVLVDGISLLKAQARQTWEQIRELCYGLKHLATVYDVPIIMTHQAVNTARGRRQNEEDVALRGDDFRMPSLNDAAFGDAFVQACSDVITMVGDSRSKYITWYSLRKTRERGWTYPVPPRMALACDFSKAKIVDLSERGYNPAEIGSEAMRVLGLDRLSE